MKDTGTVAFPRTMPPQAAEARKGPLRIFSALRHRNFRLYWLGTLVAVIGMQVQFVALSWLVYDLTGNPAVLGLVGMAQAIPTIILTLFGGVVADQVDRRKLLVFTQSITALLLLVLATLVWLQLVQVWHILAIAFLVGSVGAFDQPARMALIPHLVAREDLMNAVAMGSVVWQSSRVVGPTIAGTLIATVGIAPCFFLTTFGMLVMVGSLLAITVPQVAARPQTGSAVANLLQGVRYVWSQPVFLTLMGMTFFNSVFGMGYMTLMPVFARDILHSGSQGFGVLMGAGGVGAVLGTLSVAALGNYPHKGRLIFGGATAFGAGVVLFSQSHWFLVSLALLFFMGAVQSAYMTTTNTALQALVPDELRGRVMGLYTLAWSLMPLGGMVAGALAALAGAPFAVTVGGSLVVVMALTVARLVPEVRNLGAAEPPVATTGQWGRA